MGQLFKNISLEQRLKESVYNNLPKLQQKSNQGSVELQAEKIITKPIIELLKITPKSAHRSSDILKSNLSNKKDKTAPTIKSFIPTSLIEYKIPLSSTKFRSSINLSNRLKQPLLGSTTHLAKFILSDVNTNYIKINPFGVFYHTSDQIILPFGVKPVQGGVNPTEPLPTLSLMQGEVTLSKPKKALLGGLILSNNILTSTTTVIITAEDILQKSLIFKNGVFTSTTVISNSIEKVLQGKGTSPTISISTPLITLLQGTRLIDGTPTSKINVVAPQTSLPQGVGTIINNQSVPELDKDNILVPNTGTINTIPRVVSITLGEALKKNIRSEKALQDHQIGKAPSINTFFDPLAFSFLPTFAQVYHGNIDSHKSKRIVDNSLWSIKSRAASPLLLRSDQNIDTKVLELYITNYDKIPSKELPKYGDAEGDNFNTSKYGSVDILLPNIFDGTTRGSNTVLAQMAVPTTLLAYISDTIAKSPSPNNTFGSSTSGSNKPNSAAYKGKSINEIYKIAQDTLPETANPNTPLYGTNTEYYKKNINRVKGMYSVNSTSAERVGFKGNNDFITVRFGLTDSVVFKFTAYLTSFSDGITSTFADYAAVNNYQTIKKQTSISRSGGLSFKMAAMNLKEHKEMIAHLNNFISLCVLPKTNGDPTQDAGGICEVTVGKWWIKRNAIIESVKFDIELAETSWDLDLQLPHVITVSLSLQFIDLLFNPNSSTTSTGVKTTYFD